MKLLWLLLWIVFTAALAMAQSLTLSWIDTPASVSRYIEEYDEAGSLIGYLTKKQIESNCFADWLALEYAEEYLLVCVLDNEFDGSQHLYVEIGGDSYVERKMALVMRDGQRLQYEQRRDHQAREYLPILVPNVERAPGEYVVYASIERDGEMAARTARFVIEAED